MLNYTICAGDYIWFNNRKIYNAGRYADTALNIAGCDSITRVVLQLDTPQTSHIYLKICPATIFTYGHYQFTDTGTYAFKVKNSLGCDSSVVFHISHYINDTVVHRKKNTLIADDSATTFQWFNCTTGQYIRDSMRKSFTPKHTGAYGVYMLSSNGCVDTSACFYIHFANTQEIGLPNLNIYPNPFTDFLKIECPSGSDHLSYFITDVYGRCIAQEHTGTHYTIDTRRFEPGAYLISVWSNRISVHTYKFVKVSE
jgi:hypothetical protein